MVTISELPKPTYIPDNAETLEKSGYHQPKQRIPRHIGGIRHGGCGCEKTTEKGAYRDEVVEIPYLTGSLTVRYYHQSPVVVRKDRDYRLDSCGYDTVTTKDRINRELPSGWKVVQRDYEWFLETPNGGKMEFRDGMEVNVWTGRVLYSNGDVGHAHVEEPQLRA